MSELEDLIAENEQKRNATRQAEAEQAAVSRQLIDPEGVKREQEERKARKQELRSMLAELEAEDTDDE